MAQRSSLRNIHQAIEAILSISFRDLLLNLLVIRMEVQTY